ncbi:ABC transporter ATP-binding protein [Pandoraea sp.]|uniref:ABC transporter ATP-binding protein n=1 Tax=Pandoraea sp. TaxID=1883445 RepID=UPI001228DD8A|nr:ABC transporter ATP-binding protein [Pandoraea sp.]TAL57041.1 MAG: ABC transporter ATP-binding protein [Pandoraea sp.]TAM18084.1 MAG: ABC transporter ATP-binding protein [Pandoraea sp.]
MNPDHLFVEDIHVAYLAGADRLAVVRGLSLTLERGAIGCLLGPSGCGKTTVLRALAGFEPLLDGRIVLGGRQIASACRALAPEARRIGVVFQEHALFPHLNVADNIGFGLRLAPARQRRERVAALAALVGLSASLRRFPHELSGGQQQRVAIARALAPAPDLLLLDEPFSSLDQELRERLALEVRDLLVESGTTALLVTHDQHEAFVMADRVGVMDGGTLVQWDTPQRLYHAPATHFVADFIGRGAVLPGQCDGAAVRLELGELPLPPGVATRQRALDVLLRAEHIVLDDTSPHRVEVVRRAFRGADTLLTLRLASGRQIFAHAPGDRQFAPGDAIGVRLAARHAVTLERTGDGYAVGLVESSA